MIGRADARGRKVATASALPVAAQVTEEGDEGRELDRVFTGRPWKVFARNLCYRPAARKAQ